YCASGFFFQAEDGIRDLYVTGVQTCALPIYRGAQERVRRDESLDKSLHVFERPQPGGIIPARSGANPVVARRNVVTPARPIEIRSEERRVGKECRYRWSRYH